MRKKNKTEKNENSSIPNKSMLIAIMILSIIACIFIGSSGFYQFINSVLKSTLNITLNAKDVFGITSTIILILVIFLTRWLSRKISEIPELAEKKFFKFLVKITRPYSIITIILIILAVASSLMIYEHYYKNDLPIKVELMEKNVENYQIATAKGYTVECRSLNNNYNYLVQGDILECEYKNIKGYYDVYANVYNSDFSSNQIKYKYINNDNGNKFIQINLTDVPTRGMAFYMNLTDDNNQSKEYNTYMIETKIISKDNAENKESQKLTTLFAIISLSIISVILAVKNLKDIIEDKKE